MQEHVRVPVAVVGGGPVGMLTSLLLSRFGIENLVIERKASTAFHPKARGFNARSMEIFRQAGLEQAIRIVQPKPERVRGYASGPFLTHPDVTVKPFTIGGTASSEFSPSTGTVGSQDILEKALARQLRRLPNRRIEYWTEVIGLTQDADGVDLVARRADGSSLAIRADYVVAADGARSPTRAAAGIGFHTFETISENLNVLFEAPLRQILDPMACVFFMTRDPRHGALRGLSGVPTGRNPDEWTLNFQYRAEYGETLADFDDERCTALIREVTGLPALPVRIVNKADWTAAAALADRFRNGRVFLAGDAARLIPPAGGLGLNTGMIDAHGCAWRLAYVLRGWAGRGVLDTYDAERRGHSKEIIDASIANIRDAHGPGQVWSRAQYGMYLGYAYDGPGIVPDGTPAAALEDPICDYVPGARPGARAPHAWLDQATDYSTLDLFGWNLALVTTEAGEGWIEAAKTLRRATSLPLEAFVLEEEAGANAGVIADLYGIRQGGAVLVRPDGMVGWRSARDVTDPQAELRRAIADLLDVSPAKPALSPRESLVSSYKEI